MTVPTSVGSYLVSYIYYSTCPLALPLPCPMARHARPFLAAGETRCGMIDILYSYRYRYERDLERERERESKRGMHLPYSEGVLELHDTATAYVWVE